MAALSATTGRLDQSGEGGYVLPDFSARRLREHLERIMNSYRSTLTAP